MKNGKGRESNLQEGSPNAQRFAAILAARSNKERPSGKKRYLLHLRHIRARCSQFSLLILELEVHLRSHCQKLKVVSSNLSGAHLLIPGEVTLAIRVYYPADIERLEREHPYSPELCLKEIHNRGVESVNLQNQKPTNDLDGLAAFQSTFAVTMVFFILPADAQIIALENACSFVCRAMRTLELPLQCIAPSLCSSSARKKTLKPARVLVLSRTEDAVEAILTTAEMTLSLTKRRLKEQYFERQRLLHFKPRAVKDVASNDARSSENEALDAAAASHVASGLRSWAEAMGIPQGEADILMTVLGSLQAIVTATTEQLTHIPVEERTKNLVRLFFGSSQNESEMQETSRNISRFTEDVPSNWEEFPEDSSPRWESFQAFPQSNHSLIRTPQANSFSQQRGNRFGYEQQFFAPNAAPQSNLYPSHIASHQLAHAPNPYPGYTPSPQQSVPPHLQHTPYFRQPLEDAYVSPLPYGNPPTAYPAYYSQTMTMPNTPNMSNRQVLYPPSSGRGRDATRQFM